MDLVGPAGLLCADDDGALLRGVFDEAFRQTPVNTIYGGTAEILRSLVAEVELGLPKSR
jgi:alkylation response protein AidB-like acyl-CoA dehydrogenase